MTCIIGRAVCWLACVVFTLAAITMPITAAYALGNAPDWLVTETTQIERCRGIGDWVAVSKPTRESYAITAAAVMAFFACIALATVSACGAVATDGAEFVNRIRKLKDQA